MQFPQRVVGAVGGRSGGRETRGKEHTHAQIRTRAQAEIRTRTHAAARKWLQGGGTIKQARDGKPRLCSVDQRPQTLTVIIIMRSRIGLINSISEPRLTGGSFNNYGRNNT